MSERSKDLYHALRNIVLLVAAVLALLWFLFEIREMLLLFLFASSMAVVVNSPVTWLEKKGLPRLIAVFLVFGAIVAILALMAWLLVPRIAADAAALIRNLPSYADNVRDWFLGLVSQYPGLEESLGLDTGVVSDAGLSFVSLILRPLGRYSFSLLGWVALIIFLTSTVLYMVAYPLPLLRTYQQLLPPARREDGVRAFVNASEMIVGWIRANVIAGALEAVAVAIALSLLNVPGALLWAALAFFAELVPRLGLYLMALPPTLVALSLDPLRAVWVIIFYIALDQVIGNLVLPRVQKQTMDIHPVLILFAILTLAAAFGILGALLATPLAAILKAFYQAFYLDHQEPDPLLNRRVQQMLHVDLAAGPAGDDSS